MMSRGNQALAAVLVVQLLVVATVFWPRSATVAGGDLLFPGVEADQIVRLTIVDGDGERIQLAKSAGKWVLPEADDYPCKQDVVTDLLDKLVALKSDRPVTETRASHKRLKVSEQDYAHAIDVELTDGKRYKLYLGTAPSYNVIHFRAQGQDEVYLAADLSSADVSVQTSTWIDAVYFFVLQDQVVALTLENANGQFEFEKDDAGTWTMKDLAADETLNENSVNSLVNRASSVRMLRPLGKEALAGYGLQSPSAVIVVHTRDESGTSKTDVLHVGAKSEEDNSYVLKSSTSPYYVRAAEYTVKDWVEKVRDDFLELPPTPTPQPAS